VLNMNQVWRNCDFFVDTPKASSLLSPRRFIFPRHAKKLNETQYPVWLFLTLAPLDWRGLFAGGIPRAFASFTISQLVPAQSAFCHSHQRRAAVCFIYRVWLSAFIISPAEISLCFCDYLVFGVRPDWPR
jgi:hypothetical protein